jgi:hypothetical protein
VVKAGNGAESHVQDVAGRQARTGGVGHARRPGAGPAGPGAPASPARATRKHELRSERDGSGPGADTANGGTARSSGHLNMAYVPEFESNVKRFVQTKTTPVNATRPPAGVPGRRRRFEGGRERALGAGAL